MVLLPEWEDIARSCFDKDALVPKRVVDWLHKNDFYLTVRETEELFYYDKQNYVWIPGETHVKEKVKALLEDSWKDHYLRGIVNYLKADTYKDLKTLLPPKELTPLSNGVLNTRTLEFTPHETPEKNPNKNERYPNARYFFTTKLAVKYDPQADCPQVKQFFSEILPEEDAQIAREMIAFTLYRDYPVHCSLMLVGTGKNGKSTFISLVRNFLGEDNIANLTLQTICNDRFAKISLFQKYANLFPDLPSTALRETGYFKVLTGNDMISAERKFGGYIQFVNHAKFLFSANALPETKDDSYAFFRRWLILRFEKTFEGGTADPDKLAKITTEQELSGLLNWVLPTLAPLLLTGEFTTTTSVAETREDYIRMSDPIGAFILDCIVKDPLGEEDKERVWNAYLDYCATNTQTALDKSQFARKFIAKTHAQESKERRLKARVRVWKGITLKAKEDSTSTENELPAPKTLDDF